MTAHAITLHLPETLYERFRQRAEWSRRSLDAARTRLIREYEQTMLIRAQAARLLKDRGHDVSTLLTNG